LSGKNAFAGISSGRDRTLPDAMTIVIGGQRLRTAKAGFDPGISMSVSTVEMPVRESGIVIALSVSPASIARRPFRAAISGIGVAPESGLARQAPITPPKPARRWRSLTEMA
jgi:hypothetical protein